MWLQHFFFLLTHTKQSDNGTKASGIEKRMNFIFRMNRTANAKEKNIDKTRVLFNRVGKGVTRTTEKSYQQTSKLDHCNDTQVT